MTFLTKALDSRKRHQLYNFTITIFHYDYKIMKLNCNMKLLVTLFYFIGHHFEERLPPSPFTTVMGTLSLCIPKILLAVPHICLGPSHLLNSFLPPSLLIATFTSLTSCLALECTSDSEFVVLWDILKKSHSEKASRCSL